MFASAHFACLPPFLPANCKGQAGRSQGFHNHVHDPKDAFNGLQILLPALQGTSSTNYVSGSALCTDSKRIKNLLKERWDFSLVGIAAVKSCNDQEA
jgi:hypothetical protein